MIVNFIDKTWQKADVLVQRRKFVWKDAPVDFDVLSQKFAVEVYRLQLIFKMH